MARQLQLNVPIEINGKDVIFARDSIGTKVLSTVGEGDVYTIIEPAGTDGRPPIYIDEKELEGFRENYPGLPVYGLWQTLFANGKVALGEQLTIFRTGANSGHYLLMEAGSDYGDPANIQRSSEFIGGFLSDVHDDYDLDHAVQVVVDLDELELPDSPAQTRNEMADRRRHEQTKRWYAVGTVCLVIAFAAAAFNYAMYSVHKMNMAEYGAKKVQVDELSHRIEALLKERLETMPDDSLAMQRIDDLLTYEPELSTPEAASKANSFVAEHVFQTRPGYRLDLSSKVSGVTAELLPSMAYQLTVSGAKEAQN
ncbi:hypothetical protein ACQYZY_27265 [Pseudomonas aeruginosa]|jgi:hypothetical protein|uniref:hypothetical protein n=1 Tax=Pseudomonas aeruginosa TaxID=287 RepID=UPI001A2C4CF2|nr:hypothetical protein [Pseudomonas aeruginosa]MBH8699608.1 hypothetical protein [Pseudomonas aeruginosa]WBM10727.1 hypothetical protein M1V28_32415 [Pseudomonas aeruginosa]HCL4130908.1 hypothetical protein [Pseudomonas aeruginosa]HEK3610245.1 hypothetical protein [Pseudomonas aeruginosa]